MVDSLIAQLRSLSLHLLKIYLCFSGGTVFLTLGLGTGTTTDASLIAQLRFHRLLLFKNQSVFLGLGLGFSAGRKTEERPVRYRAYKTKPDLQRLLAL